MHPSGLAGFLLFRGPFSEITRGWYALVGQWCWRRDVGANSFPAFVVQHGHEWELWALQDSTGQSNGPRVFFYHIEGTLPIEIQWYEMNVSVIFRTSTLWLLFYCLGAGVTLVTNMVINMFVPASVTIAKLFVTSLKRFDTQSRTAERRSHRNSSNG